MSLTSFSGDGTPPQIKGLRKKATGSQNNYSSSNSGGKSPGTSKSGGSKSKGKKTITPKKNDTVDRYKEVNDALDDMTNALSDASKEADRLFGSNRLNNLKKQNQLI